MEKNLGDGGVLIGGVVALIGGVLMGGVVALIGGDIRSAGVSIDVGVSIITVGAIIGGGILGVVVGGIMEKIDAVVGSSVVYLSVIGGFISEIPDIQSAIGVTIGVVVGSGVGVTIGVVVGTRKWRRKKKKGG